MIPSMALLEKKTPGRSLLFTYWIRASSKIVILNGVHYRECDNGRSEESELSSILKLRFFAEFTLSEANVLRMTSENLK